MPTIATWNVNSIKARLPIVADWIKSFSPDVVMLQEIKCQDGDFPEFEFKALGYEVLVHGQKSYNGVAILSRIGIADPVVGLPGHDGPPQSRYVEATVGKRWRVASIYLPNGNPVADAGGDPSEKFSYKLAWMECLAAHAQRLLAADRPTLLGGDFNVIPHPADCWDPEVWEGDALMRPETRRRFHALLNQGWTDTTRALNPHPGLYSFWDYQAGAWQKNHGIRIDFLLASAEAADALLAAGVDSAPRGKEKASDHAPVWCRLAG